MKTKSRKPARTFTPGQSVSVYPGNDCRWRPATVLEVTSHGVKIRFTGEFPSFCPSGETMVFPNEIR